MRVRPTQAGGTREREGYRLVQGCKRHQCIQFREHVFVELARLAQVTAMYDPVHHHVGAGPRLRQCLEQGGKALLRIHADWNLGPGALEQTRLRAVSLSRSEEHTSELQSLMRISYAVFCLKKKKKNN